MKLSAIAERINIRAANYRMGRFQSLRKELKGLSTVPTRNIFTIQTIHEEWAFHSGGRKEIQFNIGFERINNDQFFRHGLAFSLERTQTLPNIEILFPKIERFNDYIREAAPEFLDMKMWHWYKGKRSENHEVRVISPELLKSGVFIFFGKLMSPAEINIDTVLQDFDRLLNVYEYVESEGKTVRTIAPEIDLGFQFHSGCTLRKSAAIGSLAERRINIVLRHNDIQYDLYEHLRSLYGDENVGAEIPAGGGKKIDVVVKNGDLFTFYEIKTSSNLQTCIREALAQLLEYSLWPDNERANRLVIVTENNPTEEAMKYLASLRDRFGLPIYHHRFDTQRKVLEKSW